ncbi:MAG: DnaD domain protein [Bacilli bacterium]|nr:DnaD domain protein [Bacilli bacterium]
MKNDVLNSVIKVNDNLIMPGVIVKNFDKLEMDAHELLLMLYFINQKDNVTLDVSRISKDLNLESATVFDLINRLNEKNYISIEMKKNNGVIEEFISTELFYNKLTSLLLDQKKEESDNDIYSLFEQEFGRQLSPTECENIDRWIEKGISEELVKEALKEAILSGVRSMRYIDKILFNWSNNGYKSVEDIKRKKEKKDDEVIEKIYDYDWLNE